MANPTIDESTFTDLLRSALSEPGVISSAYSAFYGYSIGNQLLAYVQCASRDIPIGPIATFNGWKEKGRFVRKGEKAIALCMPITCKRRDSGAAEPGADGERPDVYTRFVHRNNWFVLSQTDGAEFTPIALPEWNADRALATLAIDRIPFDLMDGNCQGYARARSVAVSPIAVLPHKTLIHEMAHVLLGHTAETAELSDAGELPRSLREVEAESVAYVVCAALGLPGADESRGYIQHWNATRGAEPIPESSARKIFKVANQILTAGRPAVESTETSAAA